MIVDSPSLDGLLVADLTTLQSCFDSCQYSSRSARVTISLWYEQDLGEDRQNRIEKMQNTNHASRCYFGDDKTVAR